MTIGMELGPLPMPRAVSDKDRARAYRQRHPDRAYASKRKYRHDNSKWETDASYLSRPIVAYDGEGITRADGRHDYTLLAAMSSVDMRYRTASAPAGLGTVDIFEWLLDVSQDTPGAINVIYGGGYDFNMWLGDVPRWGIERLYSTGHLRWNDYRIMWRAGKCFRIGRDSGEGVLIYDVVSFFQRSFIEACDEYLGGSWDSREQIVAMKARRSGFRPEDAADVQDYTAAELRNLIALVRELRERLNIVGLRPKRWDGPGAIAAALLARENIKAHQCDPPLMAAQAARYAYAGGRFEVVKFGTVDGPAWEYDVNSAYPAALSTVPSLTHGRWVYHPSSTSLPSDLPLFALYHVQSSAYRTDIPAPLFRRNPNGTICYPQKVTGWYWGPEIRTLQTYAERGYGEHTILSAWVFVPNDPYEAGPFAFITNLYNKRRALKKARDGAHVGIKLALNSLYGKLAQQVGARRNPDGTWRIPPFHQLEWAGYTTSWCRAKVLQAALHDPEAIIAFETDALFSSRPLPLTLSSNLGEWEETQFSALTYVQSGVYAGRKRSGDALVKSRGVDKGGLSQAEIVDALTRPLADDRIVEVSLTRFVGAGIALAQRWQRWRRWVTVTKRIAVEPTGKRVHLGCEADDDTPIRVGVWHKTICPYMDDTHSCEYPIEWVNPDEEMSELEELRREPTEWED